MKQGKLAVVGCGNWGKNLVRNFYQLLGAERVICCDQRIDVLERLTAEYPGVGTATDVEDIWKNPSITAVAIATPALTHYTVAQQALLAGWKSHWLPVLMKHPIYALWQSAGGECSW